MDNWIDVNILKKKSKKTLETIKKLSKEAIDRNIIYNGLNYNLLTLSIIFKNYNVFKILIKKGVDVNIKKNGITYSTPISQCFASDRIIINKKMIETLILNGASFDLVGIDGYNLLNNMLSEFRFLVFDVNFDYQLCKKYVKFIIFVLSKGINVNRSIEFLPLVQIINDINNFSFTIKNSKDSNKYKKLYRSVINHILYYDGNIYQEDYNGDSFIKILETKTDVDIKESIIFKGIFDIKLTIKKCLNNKIIEKIAKMLKINLSSNSFKERKNICNCISLIIENQKNLKFEEIKNIRKRKYDLISNNDTTFAWNDVSEFIPSEIIEYIDPDDKVKWIFHVSEVPMILREGKNKWTNKDISKKDLKSIYKKLEYFPEYTMEETLNENLIEKPMDTTKITLYYKFEQIGNLINTINPYLNIQNEIMKILPKDEIFVIFQLLYNIHDININFDIVRDKYYESIEELIKYLYDIIIIKLRNGKLSISNLSVVLDQVSKDYKLVKDMISIIGNLQDFNDLKNTLYYYDFISSQIAGKPIINDKKIVGYEGGEVFYPKIAKDIHDLISIRINMDSTDENTILFINEYWREISNLIKRFKLK